MHSARCSNHSPSACAHAWGVLLALGVLDSIPIPDIALDMKSSMRWKPRPAFRAAQTPALGVLPNPASDRIAFTYGEGVEQGVLEIHDAHGRLVRSLPLSGRKALVESDVRTLAEGLYTVGLVVDGRQMASAKFVVQR